MAEYDNGKIPVSRVQKLPNMAMQDSRLIDISTQQYNKMLDDSRPKCSQVFERYHIYLWTMYDPSELVLFANEVVSNCQPDAWR